MILKLKKLSIVFVALTAVGGVANADFPKREVLGVVMWGAGGATDTLHVQLIQQLKKP